MAVHALRYVRGWLREGGIDQGSYDHFAAQASSHRLNWIIISWYPDSVLKLDSAAGSFFISEFGFPDKVAS